jgi:hypothetical protein
LGAIIQNVVVTETQRPEFAQPSIIILLDYVHRLLLKKEHYVSEIEYSANSLIRTSVIRTANYSERLGPSGKFVEDSTNTNLP